MKVIIKEGTKLNNIRTVVLYKLSKFIPSLGTTVSDFNLENHSCHKILYLVNNDILENNDFAQYEFSYLVDRFGYTSNLLINRLDNESKSVLGREPSILTELEDKIVPTSINTEEDSIFGYFGATTFDNFKFISLDLDSEIYKVEIYDEMIDANHLSENPSKFYDTGIWEYLSSVNSNISVSNLIYPRVTIVMGPDHNYNLNSNDLYYSGDSHDLAVSDYTEYRKNWEEYYFQKTLNIYLPKTEYEESLNISLETWRDCRKNPNRNTENSILTRNGFYSMLQNINPISTNPIDLTVDVNSGTILGNTSLTEISELPILSKKLGEIGNDYDPSIRYNKGDRVNYKVLNASGNWVDQEWESLVDNNIGNIPSLSYSWDTVENLTNYYTSRLRVTFDNSEYTNTGEIFPSEELVIFDDSTILEVRVKEFPGFEVDLEKIKIFPPINGSNEIYRSEIGINGSIKYNYSHVSSQDLGEMFIFQGEEVLDLLRKLDYLYFISKPKEYTLSFNLIEKVGDLEEYKNWENSSNLKLNYQIGETLGTLNGGNDYIRVKTRDTVLISLNEQEKRYKLLGVSTGNNTYEVDENGNVALPIEITEQNSQLLKYTLILNCETVKIDIVEYNDFIVEDPSLVVTYNSYCLIRFYKEVEDNSNIEITINNKIITNNPDIHLSEKDESGIYKLTISNITENLEVKLKKSNKV